VKQLAYYGSANGHCTGVCGYSKTTRSPVLPISAGRLG
jgi:hypothetical protein